MGAGYEDSLFVKAARELADKGLEPRIRLYRASSDGLKLRALKELTLHELQMVTGGRDATSIESYALEKFGDGYYCAKLFSTKYGRNILERRHHFGVGDTEDMEDEDYF